MLPHILSEKYIYILALEMAGPGNRHCASFIGTLSFPISICCGIVVEGCRTTNPQQI